MSRDKFTVRVSFIKSTLPQLHGADVSLSLSLSLLYGPVSICASELINLNVNHNPDAFPFSIFLWQQGAQQSSVSMKDLHAIYAFMDSSFFPPPCLVSPLINATASDKNCLLARRHMKRSIAVLMPLSPRVSSCLLL